MPSALEQEPDNLVLKAVRSLAEATGVPPTGAFTLEKNLPIASGIGGGSADAAAALRLCLRLWNVGIDNGRLADIALSLGADVPVCLQGATVRMTGIGETLTKLDPAPEAQAALLINPGAAVSTAAVFTALQGQFSPPAPSTSGSNLAGISAAAWNDLERPAIQHAPAIATVLEALRGTAGCELARMSGSGATCFGLYPDDQAAGSAGQRLQSIHPDWWIMPCRIG